jgi:hypothetical protein
MRKIIGLVLLAAGAAALLPAVSFSQPIPRVAAEGEAIRRREKIKYKRPQPAVIQIMPNARDEKKAGGTLLQPVKKKQPSPRGQDATPSVQKAR